MHVNSTVDAQMSAIQANLARSTGYVMVFCSGGGGLFALNALLLRRASKPVAEPEMLQALLERLLAALVVGVALLSDQQVRRRRLRARAVEDVARFAQQVEVQSEELLLADARPHVPVARLAGTCLARRVWSAISELLQNALYVNRSPMLALP